jgi:hypothetical protein
MESHSEPPNWEAADLCYLFSIMLKYLAIFAVIFGLAVFVACQDERTSQESAQKPAHHNESAVPAESDESHTQENIQNPKGNTPSWYGFFRWPNGTTTWAIILTLGAIAEQTRETRKAANAALLNAQAVIVAERPWMIVDVRPTHIGTVEMTYEFFCSNEGRTPGRILDCKEGSCFVPTPDDLFIKDTDYHPVVMPIPSLKANKQVFSVKLINPEHIWKNRRVKTSDKFAFIMVFGYVLYEDTFPLGKDGTFGKHVTHWCFAYHPDGSRVFTPSGPNEYTKNT